MRDLLIGLSIVVLLFGGDNVLNYFGYGIGLSNSPAYQKIYPSFFLVLFLYVIQYSRNLQLIYYNKLLLFSIVLTGYLFLFGAEGALAFFPNTIILPILLTASVASAQNSFCKVLKNIILVFFVTSCLVAIVEKINVTAFFPTSYFEATFMGDFRSTSFNDHPLNNALLTSVIMSFVLISKIPIISRMLVYALGLVAILCYGSRSSFVLMNLALLVFIYKFTKSNWSKTLFNVRINVLSLYLCILFMLITFVWMFLNTDVPGRIATLMYIDSSAMTRVNVFSLLSLLDTKEWLLGVDTNSLHQYMLTARLHKSIENFWVIWIVKYGVIFTIGLGVLLARITFETAKSYSKFSRLFLLAVLFVLASSNNSLAFNTSVITVFGLCSFAFEDSFQIKND